MTSYIDEVIEGDHYFMGKYAYLVPSSGHTINYLITQQGTYFDAELPRDLIIFLESIRGKEIRVRLFSGDPVTGRAWGDVQTGYMTRTMGPIKEAMLVHSSRSMGGTPFGGSIVRVEYANKKQGGLVWQHPLFHVEATQAA